MEGGRAATPARAASTAAPGPPRPVIAMVLGGLSVAAIALSAWLAVQPGAQTAQTAVVEWFNQPPQPFAAVFALVNPLLRPAPLLLVSLVLMGWVMTTASPRWQRLEVLRAVVLAYVLAELMTQVLKRVADQPRPLAVIPGLDTHDYPTSPRGNAYPSAHTAVAVAVVSALWPWMRWPQRIVGATLAVLIACNRVYIGAHWPVDVLGGAAIGLLSGTVAWLVATRWPIHRTPPPSRLTGVTCGPTTRRSPEQQGGQSGAGDDAGWRRLAVASGVRRRGPRARRHPRRAPRRSTPRARPAPATAHPRARGGWRSLPTL